MSGWCFHVVRGLAVAVESALGAVEWAPCRIADQDHEQVRRLYCHALHKPGVVCIAVAFHGLPKGYKLGILLHEFGHLAAPEDGEGGADRWVAEALGIRIQYRDHPEYGKQLEWVSPRRVLDLYRALHVGE